MPGIGAQKSVLKLWSTGQIARLLGVNVKTVATWIDKGDLKGVKFPAQKPDRRVHRDELRRFLTQHDCDWALKEMDQDESAGR